MAARGAEFTPDQLARGIKRLGRERLREECETRLGKAPEGQKWAKMHARDLAAELATRLPVAQAVTLANEGMQRQRAPSVGGPAWKHEGEPPLNAARAQEAISNLIRRLPDMTDVKAELKKHEMLEGVVYLGYTSRLLQPTGDGLVWVPSRNSALILLDYQDQISTVSAKSDEDALAIGAAWAQALGDTPLTPIKLTLAPSLKHDALSPRTIQMLEAAYGRIGLVAKIVNVDGIKTRRQDPMTPVRVQTARGEADHVLVDVDVRNCLGRGDHIVGLRFQIDWTDKTKKGEERHYYSHVTLSSDAGPLILRVTRGVRTAWNGPLPFMWR